MLDGEISFKKIVKESLFPIGSVIVMQLTSAWYFESARARKYNNPRLYYYQLYQSGLYYNKTSQRKRERSFLGCHSLYLRRQNS